MKFITKTIIWGAYIGGTTAILFESYFFNWEWWLFFITTYFISVWTFTDIELIDNTKK